MVREKHQPKTIKYTCGHKFAIWVSSACFMEVVLIRSTVRPRDTRPQAARTSQVHVFKLGPKIFEMHVFARFCMFFDKVQLF